MFAARIEACKPDLPVARLDADATACRHLDIPREEQHLTGLVLRRPAEQGCEGPCDRREKSAVLRRGLGGYQDQPCVGLAGGPITAVQRDKVLDISGDQRPPLGCCTGKNLIIRESDQGRIGNNRDDVVPLGAELPGDVVRKHLVQQQPLGHRLPGQKLTLTQPRLLGGVFRGIGSSDFRVHLGGVGGPVTDRGVHEACR